MTLSNGSYDAIRWTFCAAAIIFTTGRLFLRWHFSQRPRLDDFFNVLALACLIGYSALVEFSLEITSATLWLQLYLAQVFLYWSAIYAVKAAFLALCWYVFRPSPSFRAAWWAVTAFTFLTYWPIVLSQLWTCGAPRDVVDADACTAFLTEGISPILLAQAALDLALHTLSDFAILALPLPFIRTLQMTPVRKVSVAAVFAIIVVDIVMGLLKNIAKLCLALGYNLETSLDITSSMQQCEAAIAVMVCALPAYGVLLPASRKRRSGDKVELRQSPGGMGEALPRRTRSEQTLEIEGFAPRSGNRELEVG